MRDDHVLTRAEAFAREHAVSHEQWHLLEPAFRDLREQLHGNGVDSDALYCVCVPQLVYAAIAGDVTKAVPLAVATLLLHLGTELLDDVMDGDIPSVWQGYHRNEVSLAAATLYAALTPLALAAVDASPETALAMQCTVARGLLGMSAGQRTDLALVGSENVSSAGVEDSIGGKSGEAIAIYAALAAELPGSSPAVVGEYVAMGRALGAAAQIRSECVDLFAIPVSRDLASGSRTLPIALHLECLAGQERQQFLTLLDEARANTPAQQQVREFLIDSGAVQACAVLVEIYCERALAALERAQARGTAADALHELIGSGSFYPEKRDRVTAASARPGGRQRGSARDSPIPW